MPVLPRKRQGLTEFGFRDSAKAKKTGRVYATRSVFSEWSRSGPYLFVLGAAGAFVAGAFEELSDGPHPVNATTLKTRPNSTTKDIFFIGG